MRDEVSEIWFGEGGRSRRNALGTRELISQKQSKAQAESNNS